LFITVNCWGKLVTGVGAGLYKGAPVIVVGDVFTSEYDDREGVRRASLEMRASAVGPDLSRSIVRFEQPQPKPTEPVTDEPEAEDSVDHDTEEPTDLTLSA
jgi:single-strand DNA-binding protein